MNSYEKYQVEDFIYDDFFIAWVLHKSPESETFWNQWILQHPEKRKTITDAALLLSSIKIDDPAKPLSAAEIASMLTYVQDQTSMPSRKQEASTLKLYQNTWFRIAALIVLLTGFALLFYKSPAGHSSDGYQQITVEPDVYEAVNNSTISKMVRLSDGSLALLKPGSNLRFPKTFSSTTRTVYLTGEAFFEVAHNKEKPFLVHSNGMVTRVLGTSFTVRAFKDDAFFKVIVNTGKVQVYEEKQGAAQQQSVFLLPNEELTFQPKSTSFEKKRLPKPSLLSTDLSEREFSFSDRPLSEIITKLETAYGVRIQYDKDQLGSTVLNASLSDLPLDEKVKLLCKAINANCDFSNGNIIIEKEKIQ